MQDLESFYDGYVEKVYKYFYINCLNRHVAEDLTSQTFISFIEKASETTIDDRKKYLYAIMRNTWANHLRNKYHEAVESLEQYEDFEEHANKSINEFEAKSIQERLSVFIDRLPDKQRQVAYRRFVRDMSPREIAEELSVTRFYVKTTQNRAIKSLRAMINKAELGGITQ